MSNPFLKFQTKSQKLKIKSLANSEVEVREPTVAEVAEFYKAITDDKGQFVTSKFFEAKVKRVSDCMVTPKMAVDELLALSAESNEAINEVYEAIEAMVNKEKKGN